VAFTGAQGYECNIINAVVVVVVVVAAAVAVTA
jgi:hypothetical protein